MGKLLNAEFRRLFRDQWFILTAAVMIVLFTLFMMLDPRDANNGGVTLAANLMCFVPGVIIPNFIGAEYKNGTIRNKLVRGIKRGRVLCSYFIVSVAASLIIYAFCYLIIWLFIIFSGGSGISNETFLMIINDISAIMLLSVICAMFGTLIHSKAGSVIASQVFTWGSVLIAYGYNDRNSVLFNITERLPFCQSLRYYDYYTLDIRIQYPDLDSITQFVLVIAGSAALNFLIIAVLTMIGMLIFRKQNLK